MRRLTSVSTGEATGREASCSHGPLVPRRKSGLCGCRPRGLQLMRKSLRPRAQTAIRWHVVDSSSETDIGTLCVGLSEISGSRWNPGRTTTRIAVCFHGKRNSLLSTQPSATITSAPHSQDLRTSGGLRVVRARPDERPEDLGIGLHGRRHYPDVVRACSVRGSSRRSMTCCPTDPGAPAACWRLSAAQAVLLARGFTTMSYLTSFLSHGAGRVLRCETCNAVELSRLKALNTGDSGGESRPYDPCWSTGITGLQLMPCRQPDSGHLREQS
jgi:hypothetical protein